MKELNPLHMEKTHFLFVLVLAIIPNIFNLVRRFESLIHLFQFLKDKKSIDYSIYIPSEVGFMKSENEKDIEYVKGRIIGEAIFFSIYLSIVIVFSTILIKNYIL
jgi:hypothetical protein